MKILGIDTALGVCSVALLDGGEIAARMHVEMQRGHAENLAPMVEAAMRNAAIGFRDLTRIAVTTGPGTFTGQRVGLAFARALSLALKIPAVGVTTLDAMAAEALAEGPAGIAIAVADAKRGEVYFGARTSSEGALTSPMVLTFAEAEQRIDALAAGNGRVVLAGTAAEYFFASRLKRDGAAVILSAVRQPDAVYVGRLAALLAPSDAPARPLYLRAPDAKLPSKPVR